MALTVSRYSRCWFQSRVLVNISWVVKVAGHAEVCWAGVRLNVLLSSSREKVMLLLMTSLSLSEKTRTEIASCRIVGFLYRFYHNKNTSLSLAIYDETSVVSYRGFPVSNLRSQIQTSDGNVFVIIFDLDNFKNNGHDHNSQLMFAYLTHGKIGHFVSSGDLNIYAT